MIHGRSNKQPVPGLFIITNTKKSVSGFCKSETKRGFQSLTDFLHLVITPPPPTPDIRKIPKHRERFWMSISINIIYISKNRQTYSMIYTVYTLSLLATEQIETEVLEEKFVSGYAGTDGDQVYASWWLVCILLQPSAQHRSCLWWISRAWTATQQQEVKGCSSAAITSSPNPKSCLWRRLKVSLSWSSLIPFSYFPSHLLPHLPSFFYYHSLSMPLSFCSLSLSFRQNRARPARRPMWCALGRYIFKPKRIYICTSFHCLFSDVQPQVEEWITNGACAISRSLSLALFLLSTLFQSCRLISPSPALSQFSSIFLSP